MGGGPTGGKPTVGPPPPPPPGPMGPGPSSPGGRKLEENTNLQNGMVIIGARSCIGCYAVSASFNCDTVSLVLLFPDSVTNLSFLIWFHLRIICEVHQLHKRYTSNVCISVFYMVFHLTVCDLFIQNI